MTEIYNNSQSKYTYTLNQNNNQIFVFEIILKKHDNKDITIRKIKKKTKGNIISLNNNIIYDDIDKISLTAIDINNSIQELIIDINIDHTKKYSTFINSSIYIEIFSKSNYLKCNYEFLYT